MKQTPGSLAKALYNNTPEAPSELFFRKGDVLTVIEFDYEGQPGWWLCSHRGQRGICPSNYLQLLEDNYSFVDRKSKFERSLSHSGVLASDSAKEQQGKSEALDPLETYDVPRSMQNQPDASLLTEEEAPASSCISEPLYQNEIPLSPLLTKTSPLDLYDVPRSQLPIYGNSLSRQRKYEKEESNPTLSASKSLQNFNDCRSDFGLPPKGKQGSSRNSPINFSSKVVATENTTISRKPISQTSGTSQVQLRDPILSQQNYPVSNKNPINHSNRSSLQSESAESGIVMVSSPPDQDDLYDVPRSSLPVQGANGTVDNSCRPDSSLSVSSSGVGLSASNSDSKDSLDLYDVPRSAKSYVTHMETKYDQVSRHGSTASLARDSTLTRSTSHTRHNSTSSIFSAYGYSRQNSAANEQRGPPGMNSSAFGSRSSIASCTSSIAGHPGNELYDVPRSMPPPPNPRSSRGSAIGASNASIISSRSQASVCSVDSDSLNYDVPPSSARRVSSGDSSDTLSFRGSNASDEDMERRNNELKLRASNSSFSSSSSQLQRGSGFGTSSSFLFSSSSASSADLKILPLGTKAAVSVCEKLRHEVVTSISSILDHVKPKWRTKENLTKIMPDLRFNCTRLSLGIKDVAEFATRSISNAKQTGDDALVARLHRLLTPVLNGSQIVQKDVDELEAYCWSVDRLSVSPGTNNEKNASGDALDQLILCARSLKHDVTEIANFIALNSSRLFKEEKAASTGISSSSVKPPVPMSKSYVENTLEDYDYVSLLPSSQSGNEASSNTSKGDLQTTSAPRNELDPRDLQLLEFYSSQIGVTAPLLSQSISTFISAIHQNEPPEKFNVHLKYVILLAYRMLFAGDTVHRNLNNAQLKIGIENKANDLHKSILTLYEASKVATVEFPRIAPMQTIIDKVWSTTQNATQLKKIIFDAATL